MTAVLARRSIGVGSTGTALHAGARLASVAMACGAVATIVGSLLPWTGYGVNGTTVQTFNAFDQPPHTGYAYSIGGGLLILIGTVALLSILRSWRPEAPRTTAWVGLGCGAAASFVLADRWWYLTGQAANGANAPYASAMQVEIGPWVCAAGVVGMLFSGWALLRGDRVPPAHRAAHARMSSEWWWGLALTGAVLSVVGLLAPWAGWADARQGQVSAGIFLLPLAGSYDVGGYVVVFAALVSFVVAGAAIFGRVQARWGPAVILVAAMVAVAVLVDRVWSLQLLRAHSAPELPAAVPMRYGPWLCAAGLGAIAIAGATGLRDRRAAATLRAARVSIGDSLRIKAGALLLGSGVAIAGVFLPWSSLRRATCCQQGPLDPLPGHQTQALHTTQTVFFSGFTQWSATGHTYALAPYLLLAGGLVVALIATTALWRRRFSRAAATASGVLGLAMLALAAERWWFIWNWGAFADYVGGRSYTTSLRYSTSTGVVVSALGAAVCLGAALVCSRAPTASIGNRASVVARSDP